MATPTANYSAVAAGPSASSAWVEQWEKMASSHAPAVLEISITSLVQLLFFWLPASSLLFLDLCFPAFSSRHKIQSDRYQPSWESIRHCVGHVFGHTASGIVVQLALAYLSDFKFTLFRISSALPTAQEVVLDVAYALIVREILFYYIHRGLHHPRVYKYVHKQHHRFTAPLSFAAQYAHPVEHLLANILPIMIPCTSYDPLSLIFNSIVKPTRDIRHHPRLPRPSHILTFALWLAWSLIETTVVHSGYDFIRLPWFPLPAKMHDAHHERFNVNFGGIGLMDWVHGTGGLAWDDEREGKRKARGEGVRKME